jgi:hypothetical protein
MKASIRKKLLKIREREYLVATFVVSLTSVFPVAKGEHDVRLVYDGTKCNLNNNIWVPSFWLPTIYTLSRMIMPSTWISDNNVEEMFHNFVLHDSLQPFCGVDLTRYFPGEVVDGIVQLIDA